MRKPEFDEVMAGLVPPEGPGAAVAVRRRGEVIHSAGYGLANVEWGIPIDTETVFRIGSITKQFTAAAILKLAAEGKLAVDDPIEVHLPDYPVAGRRITVRHLLNHTSGIKSYTAMPSYRDLERKDLSLDALIGLFKDEPPDFAPGERFLYNNSGYALLGAIIEAASGQTYEAYLNGAFFQPLGLTRTCYLHHSPIVAKRASGYALAPGLQNAPPLSMSLPYAAGALGSTAEDLLVWDAALRGGKAVSPTDYEAMSTAGSLDDGSPISYGFGLAVSSYRDRRRVGHGGGINGFVSDLTHWPEHDLTVAILTNSSAFPVQQAAYALARREFGWPDLVRETISVDETELAASAGYYRFPQGGIVSLKPTADAIVAHFPRPDSVYRPFEPGGFFLEDDPEATLTFADHRDGAYQQVAFQSYGGEPLTGTRTAKRESEPEPQA